MRNRWFRKHPVYDRKTGAPVPARHVRGESCPLRANIPGLSPARAVFAALAAFCKRVEANPLARLRNVSGDDFQKEIRQGARIFGATLATSTVNACTRFKVRAFSQESAMRTQDFDSALERANMIEPRPETEGEPFHFSAEYRDVALRHAWTMARAAEAAQIQRGMPRFI